MIYLCNMAQDEAERLREALSSDADELQVCCSVLQCDVECCSVLQFVAMCGAAAGGAVVGFG